MNKRIKKKKEKSEIFDALMLNPTGKHEAWKGKVLDKIEAVAYVPETEAEAKMLDELGLPYPKDWKQRNPTDELVIDELFDGDK